VEAAVAQVLGTGQGLELISIINAFDVPKISYDPVARKMYADDAPRVLFADAQVGGQYRVRVCRCTQAVPGCCLQMHRGVSAGKYTPYG
jgi:hypothetical protein